MEPIDKPFVKEMLGAPAIELPPEISAQIKASIKTDLYATKIKIGALVLAVHFIAAVLILSICPQMGVSLFNIKGIYPLFMKFGHHACQFLCGFLFISTSVVLNQLLLPPPYLNYLRYHRYHQILGLTAASLLFFYVFGQVWFNIYVVLWTLGAIAGGYIFNSLPLRFYRLNSVRISA